MSATFSVRREVQLDAGHRVPFHASKCRSPHGHRYKVVATCAGPVVETSGASDYGMVVDFGDLSAVLKSVVHDPYDHAMLVWAEDHEMRAALEGHGWKVVVVPCVPTAERLAEFWYHAVQAALEEKWGNRCRLVRLEVYETPTGVAAYEG